MPMQMVQKLSRVAKLNQILTNFQNSFTGTRGSTFAMNWVLKDAVSCHMSKK